MRQGFVTIAGVGAERQGRVAAPPGENDSGLARLGGLDKQFPSTEAPMKPPPDFNPAVAAKKLLREGRSGALATLMPGCGGFYTPFRINRTAADGAPLPRVH